MLDRTLRSWLAPSTYPPCRTKRSSRARRRLLRAEELESRTNPVGVNLDQWANLPVAAWQNGNLGQSNSLYAEGETVPFHMAITGLTQGHSYTVGIEWDTTENGGANTTPHAYDYITDYNESVTDPSLNPLLDTHGNAIPNVPAGSSTFAIPTDTRVTNGPNGAPGGGDDITQKPGAFKLYGGTLTGVSGYAFTGTYTLGTGYVGATKTGISVTFTAGGAGTNVTTVLAWGGHISSRLEWRPEPTAFNISGSPYHMRNGDSITDNSAGASTNLGQQDRSLKADAVISPGTITVIKQADPEGATGFPFTMTDQTNFNLVDDGTAANTKAFTLTTFKNYTVAELVPAGWDLTNITIATTQASGDTSTKSVAAGTATLDLDEGEDITVTFFDTAQAPSIDLEKSGSFVDDNGDGDADPGEHISYAFTVTNTGNVTLHGVTLTDPLLGGALTLSDPAGNGAGVLAPGEVETASASYVINQADIDGCEVDNNARVEGTSPSSVVVHDDANATVPLPENPSILLDKVGVFNDENGNTFADVGETISYTFTVKNTGNVTLDDVQVADDVVTPTGGASTLSPGDSTVFTAAYAITQADIDAGFKDNTAVAAGTSRCGDDGDTDTDTAHVPLPQAPSIDLEKSGSFVDDNGDGDADPGEHISYAFTVTNTGNVTLHGVTLTDPLLGGALTLSDPAGNGAGVLAPGEVETASASYVINQADIDGCEVHNTATTNGLSPSNAPVSDTDSATVPLPENPALTLVKAGTFIDTNGDGDADLGETIHYAFTVTNTGNVTLDGVTLTDPALGGAVTLADSALGNGAGVLAPGEVETATVDYIITQADIDAGFKDNTATASGTSRCGDGSASDEDSAHVSLPQAPSIDLEKSGSFVDDNGDGDADPGEHISYAFTVTNTGNVTLHGVTLTDPLLGGALTLSDPAGNGAGVLAPGEVETASASYVINQADIDGCEVHNTATTNGLSPSNAPVSDTDSATVPLPENPALTLVKAGVFHDLNGDGDADPGETISYTFTVTNTGNVTLDGVGVSDSLVTPTGGASSLSPNGSTVFTATYHITQADIDAGFKDNTATASGTSRCGDGSASDEDSAHVPLSQAPAIDLTKFVNGDDANSAPGVVVTVGSTVTFRYSFTNTGNVTLHGVALSDDVLGDILARPETHLVSNGNGDTNLDVGETWIYETTDVAVAGQHTNIGTVTGSPPTGSDVMDTDPGNYYGNTPPGGAGGAFDCIEPNEVQTGNVNDAVVDPDGDPLTFAVQSGPTYGVLVLNPLTGDFSYTANPAFPASHPVDHFTVRATDPFGEFVDATYDIELNLAPNAVNDSYGTLMNVAKSGNVLTNDSDPDGDTVFITGHTQPAHGTLVFDEATGAFTYTPNPGYAGTDSFTYTIKDRLPSGDECAERTATVSFSVSSNARTQGYWSTHQASIDALLAANGLSKLTVAGATYSSAELVTIMRMSSSATSSSANAILIVFQQLVAAKLNSLPVSVTVQGGNVVGGVALDSATANAIADAEYQIKHACLDATGQMANTKLVPDASKKNTINWAFNGKQAIVTNKSADPLQKYWAPLISDNVLLTAYNESGV